MNWRKFYLLNITAALLQLANLESKEDSNKHKCSKENIFGTGRLMISQDSFDNLGAFGVLGEGGMDNSRLDGTFAFAFNCLDCMKVSVDYLTQDLKYSLKNNRYKHQWMNQIAGGGEYRHQFWHTFFKELSVGGFYSNAKGKSLDSCKKKIAGSNFASGNFKLGFRLWRGAEASLSGIYDHVQFNRGHKKSEKFAGFGYAAAFEQFLYNTLRVQLKGEIRRPYDYAEAKIKWSAETYAGLFTFGIFSSYTNGKKGIPNVTTAGIEISWILGSYNPPVAEDSCSWSCNLPKGVDGRFDYSKPGLPLNLSSWVNTPAVYLPVVISTIDK